MTDEQLATVQAEVGTAVDLAGNLAGALNPELIPFIVLGKIVAKAMPSLVNDVERLIQGQPATDAEKADLARKVAVLADPNLP